MIIWFNKQNINHSFQSSGFSKHDVSLCLASCALNKTRPMMPMHIAFTPILSQRKDGSGISAIYPQV